MTPYEPYPAVAFPTRPEWPVYEAPARWYIQTPRKEQEA